MSVGQPIRISFLPEFEGEAVRYEDFFCRLRELRLRKAYIPEPWVIETFPFARQPKLHEKKIMALYDSLTFMTQSQNIVWLGGTGVGKSGLATSFLIHAINQGPR